VANETTTPTTTTEPTQGTPTGVKVALWVTAISAAGMLLFRWRESTREQAELEAIEAKVLSDLEAGPPQAPCACHHGGAPQLILVEAPPAMTDPHEALRERVLARLK
jgi:hypothetical protein